MKKSIAFLLASLATTSSLLFHTQEAKAGTIIDKCRTPNNNVLTVFKKNNAGNFVVKHKYGKTFFESTSREDARNYFEDFCDT